jgi:methionyl-tRNA formyltransferase
VRVVFLGTPEAAVPSLEALVAARHDVRLAIANPDRPRGRSGAPVSPPVKRTAAALGIATHQPTRVRDRAFAEALAAAEPDVLVVVAYGRILPASVLELAPHGAINVHFSLLPRLRGAAPVQWAIARGDRVTGVTTMQIARELDAGDILAQREVAIEAGEHAPALGARLARHGAELLVETLAALARGDLRPRAQDPSAATSAPILRAPDGAYDPCWSAAELEGRVRGFDPWPGVWMRVGGRRLRITSAAAVPGETSEAPGTIAVRDHVVYVACARGTLARIDAVQPEGRRAMDAASAVRGRYIGPGDRACGAPEAPQVVADPASE